MCLNTAAMATATMSSPTLDLDCAADGIHNAGKFRQKAVTGVLYDPTAVLRDLRVDQLPEMRFEALVRPLLVVSHQTRVARHVGSQDRSETSGLGQVASPAAKRRPDRKSSRCSGFRQCVDAGSTTFERTRTRLIASLASPSCPICA